MINQDLCLAFLFVQRNGKVQNLPDTGIKLSEILAERTENCPANCLSWKLPKKIDYFYEYSKILLVVSPTAKWTAKSVSNSNGVTTQMAMWKRIAIFKRDGENIKYYKRLCVQESECKKYNSKIKS